MSRVAFKLTWILVLFPSHISLTVIQIFWKYEFYRSFSCLVHKLPCRKCVLFSICVSSFLRPCFPWRRSVNYPIYHFKRVCMDLTTEVLILKGTPVSIKFILIWTKYGICDCQITCINNWELLRNDLERYIILIWFYSSHIVLMAPLK